MVHRRNVAGQLTWGLGVKRAVLDTSSLQAGTLDSSRHPLSRMYLNVSVWGRGLRDNRRSTNTRVDEVRWIRFACNDHLTMRSSPSCALFKLHPFLSAATAHTERTLRDQDWGCADTIALYGPVWAFVAELRATCVLDRRMGIHVRSV